MSGLLDNKTRVIDVFLTQEGKRQISVGDLKVEFASFTDSGIIYSDDLISGSQYNENNLSLEQCSLPQDQITFEADDSGQIVPFKNELGIRIKNGRIISNSFSPSTTTEISGSTETVTFLKGDEFASLADSLLASSLGNYKKLQIIGSSNSLNDNKNFAASPNNVEFVINDKNPINDQGLWVSHINHVESLFNDPRLSNVKNFNYLPPINRVDDKSIDVTDHKSTSKYHLGRYPIWGTSHLNKLSYNQIKFELDYFEDKGYSKTISFDPTSQGNRLMLQMFEKKFDRLQKLDVIDFGKHVTGNSSAPTAHIFFLGKIFEDDNDTHTFVHLFTLVFE